MRENSIFTITPPDMMLSDEGPSVTVLSTDEDFIKRIESIQENLFRTVSVNIYHPNGPVTENKLAWLISVMRLSDTIYVDLNTVNDIGLLTALLSSTEVACIDQGNKRRDIAKLFNSIAQEDLRVYDSLDDYLEMMMVKLSLT